MSAIYDKALQRFLEGQIAYLVDTVKSVIVDTADYTVNLAAHEFLSDVPVAARVATATLAGKTSLGGVADANNTTFVGVNGDPSEAIILYKDTGLATTSPLMVYLDQGTGFLMVPNGGDVVVLWNPLGIFKL